MTTELRVPEVGESITEVTIGDWLCEEGASVETNQVLLNIETDKVTVEIHAPERGRVSKRVLLKGATARVGTVVGLFEAGALAADAPAADAPAVPVVVTEVAKGPEPRVEPAENGLSHWASPGARRALAEHGLRADQVESSDPIGRLHREDVERHLQTQPSDLPLAGALQEPQPGLIASPSVVAQADEDVVPMSPFRIRIAQRLVEAQQHAALLTTFNEIDLSTVQLLRKELQSSFQEKYGTKLGLMSFFVKAVADALRAVPVINAEVRGSDIVYKNHYDIGIAVGGGKGLVVPVVRHVERLGFAEIEQQIADYGARAKANKIELHELQGGTFTISNGGVYGSMLSTPIVNPPQSAILGLHAIIERPVARDGQVVIRPMMYVALTYDHRIIDGREAVTFLRMVKDFIEQPARALFGL